MSGVCRKGDGGGRDDVEAVEIREKAILVDKESETAGEISVGQAEGAVLAAEGINFIDILVEASKADGMSIIELLIFEDAASFVEALFGGGDITAVERGGFRGRIW